jgi:hypothetical protein
VLRAQAAEGGAGRELTVAAARNDATIDRGRIDWPESVRAVARAAGVELPRG